MKRKTLLMWGLVVFVGAVVILLVATRVGGMSIRSASSTREMGVLNVGNEVLSRGVPVKIQYRAGQVVPTSQTTVLGVRSAGENAVIKGIPPVDLNAGLFSVEIPCSEAKISSGEVRLVLMDERKLVIAQSDDLELLLAGPECFYGP